MRGQPKKTVPVMASWQDNDSRSRRLQTARLHGANGAVVLNLRRAGGLRAALAHGRAANPGGNTTPTWAAASHKSALEFGGGVVGVFLFRGDGGQSASGAVKGGWRRVSFGVGCETVRRRRRRLFCFGRARGQSALELGVKLFVVVAVVLSVFVLGAGGGPVSFRGCEGGPTPQTVGRTIEKKNPKPLPNPLGGPLKKKSETPPKPVGRTNTKPKPPGLLGEPVLGKT